MHQSEQITVTEAAKILGCSRWTVVRMITREVDPLPARKSGDSTSPWLIKLDDVEARVAA